MIEYQRSGRNKDVTINQTYIASGEFRNKFDKIVSNKYISRILFGKAKEMLFHRTGTKYEDMYWIDADTGDVIASVLDSVTEEEIIYNSSVVKKLNRCGNIIAMHTHPNSMPPSIPDFNSMYEHKYIIGIVVCHDGKVFTYSSKEEVRESLFDLMIAEYYNNYYNEKVKDIHKFEYQAQLFVLNEIRKSYDISFEEVGYHG